MVTSCDPINPYTQTGTFGVSYNGGYKPDTSLEWIPVGSNTVESSDDFIPPPILPPPNMLMNTREGRKVDPRVGTVTKREMEFDDFTESQEIVAAPPTSTPEISGGTIFKEAFPKVDEDTQMKFLILLSVILLVILFTTKFS
jgi:hypothetical protein